MTRSPKKSKRARAPARKSLAQEDASGTSQSKVIRSRKGKLENLPDMPLDVLNEIFGLLHPSDLLRLARTTKAFRALLMSRSSTPMWRGARRQIEGLPDCPSWLSEPQYANLAFDSHCHRCLKSGVQKIAWLFRARLCKNCVWQMTVNMHPLHELPDAATAVIPDDNDDLDLIYACLNNLRDWEKNLYYIPDILALGDIFLKFQSEPEERTKAIEEHEIHTKQIKEHARLCETWFADAKNNRASELDAARARRLTAITDHLKDLGWTDELNHMDSLYRLKRHRLVRQAKDLTPRIWQNIKPKLVTFMEEVKAARIVRDARIAQMMEEFETDDDDPYYDDPYYGDPFYDAYSDDEPDLMDMFFAALSNY